MHPTKYVSYLKKVIIHWLLGKEVDLKLLGINHVHCQSTSFHNTAQEETKSYDYLLATDVLDNNESQPRNIDSTHCQISTGVHIIEIDIKPMTTNNTCPPSVSLVDSDEEDHNGSADPNHYQQEYVVMKKINQ